MVVVGGVFVVVILSYQLPASINFKLSVLKFSRYIDLGRKMCIRVTNRLPAFA